MPTVEVVSFVLHLDARTRRLFASLRQPTLQWIPSMPGTPAVHKGRRPSRTARPSLWASLTRWAFVASALAGTGCNAHVNKFDASVRYVCPGQRVDIVWNVTGSAKFEVTPDVPGTVRGAVPSIGQTSFIPTQNTRASIRVTRSFGEPTGADIDFHMSGHESLAADLNDSPSCEGGVLTLKPQIRGFSPDMKAIVVTVQDGEQRELDVSRLDAAGRPITAHVGPGKTTDAFATLPVNGQWIFTARLGPGESCTNAPHVLTVYAYTGCTGGTK